MSSEFPKKYKHQEIEQRWAAHWEETGIYNWDASKSRDETFVVDTPPPTVSGSLHVGHVFSYTHTDCIVRYQRMRGKNIFYPMGWDDNGLPTERRVQNFYHIRCDPHLPYDPNWEPSIPSNKERKKDPTLVSRKNFIETCDRLTVEDEKAFKRLWQHLALSVDWGQEYATVGEHCRRVSQLSFLDLWEKGQMYNTESPTMWDVDFRSAIAQAELEDKEIPGAYHDIRFSVEGGGELTISTTRPELLGACIAVVAHPDDERYKPLFGKTAITPLFHAPVPICPADHADPEKGTGILMVCTFGDIMDVEWWKQSDLPLKQLIGRDGRMLPVTFGEEPFASKNPQAANAAYAELSGLGVKQAQKRIAELLAEDGSAVDGNGAALVAEPKPITHPVKFFEKGERPIEFIPTRQWFVKILDYKKELLEQGRKVTWHPDFMRTRYEHWVEGLNQDWCYSRQRYFGVPIPVWYPLRDDGEPDYDNPILPSRNALPIDPLSDVPTGFEESQRDVPGGFTGDPDVMDTWSTSSMTPQISSFWGLDEKRHAQLFPADIRPQAHEIIRTWAFTTIVKAWMHSDDAPWRNIVLSGWILDPDRKKMSKSKGNVVTPNDLLDEYSADAVRYWAARARLGTDTAYDATVFKIGYKLVNKLFNASKFALMQLDGAGVAPADLDATQITEELDRAFIQRLRGVVESATKSFSQFDYATALQRSEESFWEFCDYYVELVKVRSYSDEDSPGRTSALATLSLALKTYLRLFAPSLPYITEEVWSWRFATDAEDSVHTTAWPALEEFDAVGAPSSAHAFDAAMEVISQVRAAKTEAQKNQKWAVDAIEISCSDEIRAAVECVAADLQRAGNIAPDGIQFKANGSTAAVVETRITLSSED